MADFTETQDIAAMILVVGDNKYTKELSSLLRDKVPSMLERECVVDGLPDSEKAYDLIREEDYSKELPYDLIITDLGVEEGLKLMKEVKERKPATGVFVMDEYTSVEQALDVMGKGADGFINKPFKPEYVLGIVKSFFEKQYALKSKGVKATIATVDHEISTPLNVILGNAQLLLTGGEDISESTRERLKEIDQQTRRTAEAITYLDRIEKPVFGEDPPGAERVDLVRSKYEGPFKPT